MQLPSCAAIAWKARFFRNTDVEAPHSGNARLANNSRSPGASGTNRHLVPSLPSARNIPSFFTIPAIPPTSADVSLSLDFGNQIWGRKAGGVRDWRRGVAVGRHEARAGVARQARPDMIASVGERG